MTAPGIKRKQRFGCGFLALLVFVSFMFGLLGGGLAGAGLLLLYKPSLLTPPALTPTPTPIQALPTAAPSPLSAPGGDDASVIQAVKTVGPAVVTVVTTLPARRGFFGSITQPEARGSGVIISPDGRVITNNHVVEGGQSLSVILASGERLEGKLVGSDTFTDLAVIQISGSTFPFAQLGDSATLTPGQRVIAIGSALGDFRNTVTMGIVSGLGRSVDTDNDFKLEDLIQTDAAINQGNSGGPLVDINGRVVGINTLIVGRSTGGVVAEGLGFAMSINTVREVADQLIANGRVARPYLGIGYQSVTPQLASYYGLSVSTGILVTSVSAKSPAAVGGVQVGDVILTISEQAINDSNPYLNALMHHRPGDKVKLGINRSGQSLSIDVVLGQRQD